MIRHSFFYNRKNKHGGFKRTAQISGILQNTIFECQFITDLSYPIAGFSAKKLVYALNYCRKLQIYNPPGALLSKIGKDYLQFHSVFSEYGGDRVFIWEGTRSNCYHLPLFAKEAGFKVIAMPHNLESLVPEQKSFLSGKTAPDWLDEELKALRICDHVITISREEQWLLRLNGISADFLPYYPPPDIVLQLAKVRERRLLRDVSIRPKKILLFGTIGNPPTRIGMVDRINTINHWWDTTGPEAQIHVAGYGTGQLHSYVNIPDGVILHGALGKDRLDDLLVAVDAVIIHQEATTGCLTKIPELLLAGVPVLVNADSCRSSERYSGVHVYETDEELRELLQQKLSIPNVYEKPVRHEARMLQTITSMLGKS